MKAPPTRSIMRPMAAAVFALYAASTFAEQVSPDARYKIPGTVSPEAAAVLKPIYEQVKAGKAAPQNRPVTLEDFEKHRAPGEAAAAENFSKLTASLGVSVKEDRIGGVPVLRIKPLSLKRKDRVLIYVHGGAYVMGSARSTVTLPAKFATAGGYDVISVDYTLAPRSKWKETTAEVISVWKALLANGAKPATIGWFGESAGAGLIAGTVLRMSDEKLPLPGALYLMSPWADITLSGDTMETLAAEDPLIPVEDVEWVAANYAAPEDQKNPYVSPVYGKFAGAYPPTLIQAGTREVLLSASVRLYQAMRAGGKDATLDVYEGMPHVFQGFVPDSPEGKTATERALAFFKRHLKR